MSAEIIAILSALGWAGDSVLVRLGIRKSNIVVAMVVSFVVSATCITTYLLFFSPLDFLRSPAMPYFFISGCMQPLLARGLFYTGITRLGVSRAGPLRGVEPLFATGIAMAVFQERPGLVVLFGTVLIVVSLWLISARQSGEAKWRLVDTAFPLSAALVSAISQTLRKQGLKILPDPLVAAVTVTWTSLALLLIFLIATRRTHLLRIERPSIRFFLAAGLIATVAQVFNFVALGRAEVSVIIPLLNTTPLFAVFLSCLFLRDVEKVTSRIILGAVFMVAGVVIIASR